MNSAKHQYPAFAYGAGHINPVQAVNPGLVYETQVADYVKFLCDTGYDTYTVRKLFTANHGCSKGNEGNVSDLNYPSLTYFNTLSLPFKIKIPRIVTNVGRANSTYRVKISKDPRINVTVTPQVLSFKSLGAKKSFVVTVSGKGIAADSVVSGSLMWSDETYRVRSPFVIYG
ncbi:hypothetical protein U1Q18_014965 [Sarracenia purpurea var. burkii]